MMWRRDYMSNDEARAALRRSGNSFQDAAILARVPGSGQLVDLDGCRDEMAPVWDDGFPREAA